MKSERYQDYMEGLKREVAFAENQQRELEEANVKLRKVIPKETLREMDKQYPQERPVKPRLNSFNGMSNGAQRDFPPELKRKMVEVYDKQNKEANWEINNKPFEPKPRRDNSYEDKPKNNTWIIVVLIGILLIAGSICYFGYSLSKQAPPVTNVGQNCTPSPCSNTCTPAACGCTCSPVFNEGNFSCLPTTNIFTNNGTES